MTIAARDGDQDDAEHGPTLADNPGLEHDAALPEGLPMTGSGSRGPVTRRRPAAPPEEVSLEDDPGLEHDAATARGSMMTGEGTMPDDGDDAEEDA